jgi:hypothetical protein
MKNLESSYHVPNRVDGWMDGWIHNKYEHSALIDWSIIYRSRTEHHALFLGLYFASVV